MVADSSRSPSLLVVEDDPTAASLMIGSLERQGMEADHVSTCEAAHRRLKSRRFDCVILDLKLPDGSGYDLQDQIRKHPNPPPLVFVTGEEDVESAVAALLAGAEGYVVKRPNYLQRLEETLRRVLGALGAENPMRMRNTSATASRYVDSPISPMAGSHPVQSILGTSSEIRRVRREIELAARHEVAVLVTGETGTGKELAARAIHAASSRAARPLIPVNCAAVTPNLFESELFGSVRGAYTGAERDRPGLFGEAMGGTILLDEIGELSLESQAKLLRVLDEGRFRKVGGTKEVKADVRVVAATNRELGAAVQRGEFRADLFYRLDVLRIEMPPLRSRLCDIPVLVDHFLALERDKLETAGGAGVTRVDAGAYGPLKLHAWPGNVRELRHVVARTLVRSSEAVIRRFDLRTDRRHLDRDRKPRRVEIHWEDLAPLLVEHRGRLAGVARNLGISTRTLQRRVGELGINPADFRTGASCTDSSRARPR